MRKMNNVTDSLIMHYVRDFTLHLVYLYMRMIIWSSGSSTSQRQQTLVSRADGSLYGVGMPICLV